MSPECNAIQDEHTPREFVCPHCRCQVSHSHQPHQKQNRKPQKNRFKIIEEEPKMRLPDPLTWRRLRAMRHSSYMACNSLAVLHNGQIVSSAWMSPVKSEIRRWDPVTGETLDIVRNPHNGITGWISVAALSTGQLASAANDRIIFWGVSAGGRLWQQHSFNSRGKPWCLAELPHGQLAAGDLDGSIIVWDIYNREKLYTLRGHDSAVWCLAVLPYEHMASGSSDKTIIIWDVYCRVCLMTLEGHSGIVRSLAVLADGQLASGSHDTTIKFWDLSKARCTLTLVGHEKGIQCLATAGDILISGSYDNMMKCWSVTSGHCIYNFETSPARVMVWLAENQLVAGLEDGTVTVWGHPLAKSVAVAWKHRKKIVIPEDSTE